MVRPLFRIRSWQLAIAWILAWACVMVIIGLISIKASLNTLLVGAVLGGVIGIASYVSMIRSVKRR